LIWFARSLYPDVDALHHVTFPRWWDIPNGRGQQYSNTDLLLPLPTSEMQRNPN